jgi:hypothetical protein
MTSSRVSPLGLAPVSVRTEASGERSATSSRPPVVLAAALLVICLYAAFDHGAVGGGGNERVQLALAAIGSVAAAAWLWNGALILRAPAIVWLGVALLAAFAVWSGITLAWSVAPDQTWSECNRAITYVLFLVLAIAVGSSYSHALELVAGGFLAVALAVTAYALGQKLLPGLHVDGIFQLDQTAVLTRLQEPLGYWNALALFISMGIPCALAIAVERRRRPWLRLAAVVAAALMLETIAFTYSRGGVLALLCGLAVGIAVSGARLRYMIWLGLIGAASAPAIVVGLVSHDLTAAGVSLGARERAGLELAAVLIACLMLLVLAGRRLIVLERRARLSRLRARRVGRALALMAAGLLAVGLLAVALTPPSPRRAPPGSRTRAACCPPTARTGGCGGRRPPARSALGRWAAGGLDRSPSCTSCIGVTRCRSSSPTACRCSSWPRMGSWARCWGWGGWR